MKEVDGNNYARLSVETDTWNFPRMSRKLRGQLYGHAKVSSADAVAYIYHWVELRGFQRSYRARLLSRNTWWHRFARRWCGV